MTATTSNSRWPGHLMLSAWDTPQNVLIYSQIRVWNNQILRYVPLYNYPGGAGVTVSIADLNHGGTATFVTNSSGVISGNISLRPTSECYVVFEVTGLTYGFRFHPENCYAQLKPWISNGIMHLFPSVLKIPHPVYTNYNLLPQNSQLGQDFVDLFSSYSGEIEEFEDNYSDANVNVVVEGDSWFQSLSGSKDLYDYIAEDFRSTSRGTNHSPAFLTLQHWGHTSYNMLKPVVGESQYAFLLEYILKYRFDLLLLSCGGNDFALQMHNFVRQVNPVSIEHDVNTIIQAHGLGINVYHGGGYDVVAAHVLAAIGSAFDHPQFPNPLATIPFPQTAPPFEQILDLILNRATIRARFNTIRTRIQNLIDDLNTRNYTIPIISHTYCYPLYSNRSVRGVSIEGAGPFLHPAFENKGIHNKVLQAIGIKGLMDAFVEHVLAPLKAANPTFDFADLRALRRGSPDWADEMHMTDSGFRAAASLLYLKIKSRCGNLF